MAHAKLSPSGAARWLGCPGSVKACEGIPEQESAYASEGTNAHAEAERVISAYLKGEALPDVFEYPYIGAYVRYVCKRIDEGCQAYPEESISIECVTGEADAHGTADCVLLDPDKGVLEIADLKYGAGVPVAAEGNLQLQIYALGALREYGWVGDFTTIRLTIVQARIVPEPQSWEVSLDDLLENERVFKGGAAEALAMLKGGVEVRFNPSKSACRFCRAAGKCKAFAQMVADTTKVDFPDLADEDDLLSPKARVEIFKRLDDVKAWLTSFETAMLKDALAGEKFPGMKLVLGRAGIRKWSDEQSADDILSHLTIDRYKRKLLSPSETEKMVKAGLVDEGSWKKLQEFIIRPEPKPILAASEDKRKEYDPVQATGAMFEDISK